MTAAAKLELPRTLALVGLMGAGKSIVGHQLAVRLGLPFIDVDHEIEIATGLSIEEIFDLYGELTFRDIESQIVGNLLCKPVHILSTGGGAFINQRTRGLITTSAISLWLKADLDSLIARTALRNNRPLLKNGDPRETLRQLQIEREPIYATADVTINSSGGSLEEITDAAIAAIAEYIFHHPFNQLK